MNPLTDFYDIVDTLKDDNNGKVQLAYDKAGQQICVIKQRNIASADLYYKLKEINNKYVPEIYRIIKFDGTLFIVEEYIDGSTLTDILKYENQIDENFAVYILYQICDCLKNLHSQNIVHRDIKPSNIMLTKSNEVKLIDFSIARIAKNGLDSDTERLGTRGYAPPEQYGFGQTDARSDIYSLGITIKRLLGKNYHGYLNKVISRCTNLDPANRYDSVSELLKDISKSRWQWRFKRFIIGMGRLIFIAAIIFLIPKDIFNDDSDLEETPKTDINKLAKVEKPKENQSKAENPPNKVEWPEIKWNDIELDTKPVNPPENADVNLLPFDNNQHNINYTLLLNGQKFNDDMQGINQNVWLNWHREKDIIYLPDDWTLDLKIDNQTNSDLNDLKLSIAFGRDEKIIPLANIKSKSSAVVNIPISNRKFSNTNFKVEISLLNGQNNTKFHKEIRFSLIDYPSWRMEQNHQQKL